MIIVYKKISCFRPFLKKTDNTHTNFKKVERPNTSQSQLLITTDTESRYSAMSFRNRGVAVRFVIDQAELHIH